MNQEDDRTGAGAATLPQEEIHPVAFIGTRGGDVRNEVIEYLAILVSRLGRRSLSDGATVRASDAHRRDQRDRDDTLMFTHVHCRDPDRRRCATHSTAARVRGTSYARRETMVPRFSRPATETTCRPREGGRITRGLSSSTRPATPPNAAATARRCGSDAG
jgi:hypothetical protein